MSHHRIRISQKPMKKWLNPQPLIDDGWSNLINAWINLTIPYLYPGVNCSRKQNTAVGTSVPKRKTFPKEGGTEPEGKGSEQIRVSRGKDKKEQQHVAMAGMGRGGLRGRQAGPRTAHMGLEKSSAANWWKILLSLSLSDILQLAVVGALQHHDRDGAAALLESFVIHCPSSIKRSPPSSRWGERGGLLLHRCSEPHLIISAGPLSLLEPHHEGNGNRVNGACYSLEAPPMSKAHTIFCHVRSPGTTFQLFRIRIMSFGQPYHFRAVIMGGGGSGRWNCTSSQFQRIDSSIWVDGSPEKTWFSGVSTKWMIAFLG